MRRLIVLVLISALLLGLAAPAAYAGSSTATNVALGLASFAVFNQLVRPLLQPRPAYARPVYEPAPHHPVIYTQQPQVVVVQPPPAPPAPTVVYYSHGRYELRANGTQYYWVWIPNPPPPPPPPSAYPAPPPPAAPPVMP
jgi:hypothetical protein